MAQPAADVSHPLPRGPHHLPRAEVVRSQRERLLRAMAETTAEKGYAQTTVADVLRRAGVSRDTFYQQFSSKQACFAAAYEGAAALILSRLEHEAAAPGSPIDRFDRTIGVYLDAVVAEPAFAHLFLVEVFAAGGELLVKRAEIDGRFADLMVQGLGAADDPGVRFAAQALVAGIGMMVTTRLAANDVEGVRALRRPLVELVRGALGPGRR